MLKPLKSLGQNFLVDKNIIRKVVDAAEIKSDEIILEIGPGRGALTFELAKQAKKIIAIEKDKGLARCLEEEIKSRGIENVEIIHGDVLKALKSPSIPLLEGGNHKDVLKFCRGGEILFPFIRGNLGGGGFKVISNPPYEIASRALVDFLVSENSPEKIVFVIQKEVGEKALLKRGKMNLFSVLVQAFGEPKIISNISRRSFSPQPRVDSVILSVDKKIVDFNKTDFLKIAKLGFSSKRKKLISNLGNEFSKEKLVDFFNENGLDKDIRAQDLENTYWILLTKKFNMLK